VKCIIKKLSEVLLAVIPIIGMLKTGPLSFNCRKKTLSKVELNKKREKEIISTGLELAFSTLPKNCIGLYCMFEK